MAGSAFTFQIILWLWFTVLFANFAEAVAEGPGQGGRRIRCAAPAPRTQARLLSGPTADRTAFKMVPGTSLKVGDVVPRRGERNHSLRTVR